MTEKQVAALAQATKWSDESFDGRVFGLVHNPMLPDLACHVAPFPLSPWPIVVLACQGRCRDTVPKFLLDPPKILFDRITEYFGDCVSTSAEPSGCHANRGWGTKPSGMQDPEEERGGMRACTLPKHGLMDGQVRARACQRRYRIIPRQLHQRDDLLSYRDSRFLSLLVVTKP